MKMKKVVHKGDYLEQEVHQAGFQEAISLAGEGMIP